MDLTKEDIKIFKAVSVLAMVCLHLFDRTDYAGLFTPLIFLFGRPLSFYFGQLSDFCVMGFAFCSGYAHYVGYTGAEHRNYYVRRLKALFSLYVNFWIVLFLFCALSVLFGNGAEMPGNLWIFLGNFTTLRLTYNGAWWYLFTFAILVLCLPVLMELCHRFHGITVLLVSGVIYCVAFYFRFYHGNNRWILSQFGTFGMTLFEYLLGAVCSKYHVFNKAKQMFTERVSVLVLAVMSIITMLSLLLGRTLVLPNILFAPISGIVILFLVWAWKRPKWLNTLLLFVGGHSTNIWLTHMFFYLVLFRGLVYQVQYPILIYILMLLITIVVSTLVNLIYKPIDRLIRA